MQLTKLIIIVSGICAHSLCWAEGGIQIRPIYTRLRPVICERESVTREPRINAPVERCEDDKDGTAPKTCFQFTPFVGSTATFSLASRLPDSNWKVLTYDSFGEQTIIIQALYEPAEGRKLDQNTDGTGTVVLTVRQRSEAGLEAETLSCKVLRP